MAPTPSPFRSLRSLRKLANPLERAGGRWQNIDPNHTGRRAGRRLHISGVGCPEPGAGIDRFTALADLEIELGPGTSTAVARGGNSVPGRHLLADPLQEPLVVAVEAQVSIPMVDDGEEPEARQPVGIDDAPLAYRLHRGTPVGRHQDPVPTYPARARVAEARHQVPAHRPGELAAEPGEGVISLDGVAERGGAQLAQQLLHARLLTAQPLEVLSARVRLDLEAREHVSAPLARLLEIQQLGALLLFQLRELLVRGGELVVELCEPPHVVLDEADLPGARPAEIAVVHEHA